MAAQNTKPLPPMSTAVLVFVAVVEKVEDLGGSREGGDGDVLRRGLDVWDV